jgi:membrane-bound serine protease (ClpP class)
MISRLAAQRFVLSTLCWLLLFSPARAGADTARVVFRFSIMEQILPGTARQVSRAMEQAEAAGADAVVIHMNTYGGMLDAADSIRTRLLNSPVRSIVYIDNNAASAGALIAIACHRIYMRGGASIGAATVVNAQAEALPDKYQSYMRSMMRATAEKRGRDPRIAEAMVDPAVSIPGVIDSGKVLTFTTSEATAHGFCDGTAETVDEVLRQEGLAGAKQMQYEPTWVDGLIGFLMNPAVSGILILIIIGGIYYELQSPGIGFPLLAAGLAAILYFAPLYLEGLAANWEILLIIAGFVLLAVELFVLPGFGVAGIAGIACIIAGFAFTLVPNEGFDFRLAGGGALLRAFGTVLIALAAGIVLTLATGRNIIRSGLFRKLVLEDSMAASQGYVSGGGQSVASPGQPGVAYTALRPAGKVSVEGRILNAVAELGFIDKGQAVIVTSVDGLRVVVRPAEEAPQQQNG